MFRALPLLALSVLLSGCFVLDELDASRDMLKKEPEEEAAEAPGKDAAKTPAGREWWSNAKSFSPGDAADAAPPGDPKQLVSCRVGGATRFMRRGDCVSQGGTPKS